MKKGLILFIALMIAVIAPAVAQEEQGLSDAEIGDYPQPAVIPLQIDNNLLYDRIYRQVEGNLAIYDAPGGNLVEDLGEGYNYVTLAGAGTQGDWTQISAEYWLPSNLLSEDVMISRFAGVLLPEDGTPYPTAWLLRHTYPSLEPGSEDPGDNSMLYRYTVVTIYATVAVDGYNWYQIGIDKWVHQFDVAKIIPVERPEDANTDKWVSVDLYEQVLIAYEGETPVFATLVSSGLSEWSTNEGVFNVYLRRERTLMSGAYGLPDFYYLQEVPWTMFFDADIALHGTYWHDGFGYRQSHGCVNLSIMDSHWLYNWSSDVRDFTVEDSPDLSVYVYSSGEYD